MTPFSITWSWPLPPTPASLCVCTRDARKDRSWDYPLHWDSCSRKDMLETQSLTSCSLLYALLKLLAQDFGPGTCPSRSFRHRRHQSFSKALGWEDSAFLLCGWALVEQIWALRLLRSPLSFPQDHLLHSPGHHCLLPHLVCA